MSASSTEPDRTETHRPFREAITGRSAALVLGVLALQLAFIYSYVGAFHQPKPHHIPIDVVAPAPMADQLVSSLDALPDEPLSARAVADADTARTAVRNGSRAAALIIDPAGTTDTLLVAGAAGSGLSDAVERIVVAVQQQQDRQLTVEDLVRPQPGDNRGLTTFYLVVGWLVGGYLAAAALGGARGARPATWQRAVVRLASMVPYAVVSGIGGALLVDTVLGALTGHFWTLAWVGALLVLAASATALALQILWGLIGIGVTLLVFVIIGNPSAGGAFPLPLLPPLWREVGPWLPGGAGVTAIRRFVYFEGHNGWQPVLVIVGWCVAGSVLMLAAAALLHRHRRLPGPG